MSFELDQANAELPNLDIKGFANPPLFLIGTYNFKCAIDSKKQIWTTEVHADHDLLGWNDLLCYPPIDALEQVRGVFGLNLLPIMKYL